MPRRTSSPIRSVAPGPLSSSTARSQAASSRDTSAPAAATTPPSFERNNRSRVASKTRLGMSERDLHDLLHQGRPAPEQVKQPVSWPHDQDGIAWRRLHQTLESKEERPRAPCPRVKATERGGNTKGAVIEEDRRVQIGPAPAPLERHAFTQRVDVAVHRMGERLGADVHRHHTAPELRWDLAYQPLDKRT